MDILQNEFAQTPDRHDTGSIKWDSAKRRFGVEGLTPFWIADMDYPIAPCIREALSLRMEHPVFGYTSPPFSYKKALCSWYRERHGWEIYPDWLLPTPNTMTVMTILLEKLLSPQDKCLVFSPVYDAFFTAVKAAGLPLVQLPLTEAGTHYELDFHALEAAFAAGVRCLLLCNPHNPGGKVWTEEELSQIVQLCDDYDILIISDDVHGDWVFQPHRYTPILGFPEAAKRTILITAPSKSFNLAGLNASCLIVAGETLRSRVETIFSGMAIRGSHLFAYTAMEAAYTGAGSWMDEVKNYVWQNILRTKKCLGHTRIRIFDPESTFLLWMDCREICTDSRQIRRDLAETYKIAVNAGDAYGEGGNGFIRFNVACSADTLQTGLEALLRWEAEN